MVPFGGPASDDRPRWRGAEDTVARFLESARRESVGLLIAGEEGIGKTSLALGVVDEARRSGFRVAATRVARPETALSYAALGDLLESVGDVELSELPVPQRQALSAALLRSTEPETVGDARAVSLGALGAVRRMAVAGPLLIAIDGIQWLDPSSARVIGFVLRRLDTEPVGILSTQRSGEIEGSPLALEEAMPPHRLLRIELGPMGRSEFGHLLRTQVGTGLPHSVVTQLHELVEGNPFYGQQLARELLRRGVPEAGAPLPLSPDVFGVVTARVRALPEGVLHVLAHAALTACPTISLLRSACPEVDVDRVLEESEDEGMVEIRLGVVVFTHPLLASAVTATRSPLELRRAHRRLAEVVQDPEKHARHLALGCIDRDEGIALALERAHESARLRGAAAAAAELALLALHHTDSEDRFRRARRGVVAGMLAFEAGDAARGHALLHAALEESPAGPVRADVMVTLSNICWPDTVEIEALADAALAETDANPATVAAAHLVLGRVSVHRGELAQAECHIGAARASMGSESTPAIRADLLTVDAVTSFLAARPHEELLEEAVSIENRLDAAPPVDGLPSCTRARVVRGLIQMWAGDLDAARGSLEGELARLELLGRYVARDEVLCYLAELGCRSGHWEDARRRAEQCLEIGEESGHLRGRGQNIVPRAWVAALRGELDAARTDAHEGLALSTRLLDRLTMASCRGVLGFVELSEGNPEGAVQHLRHVRDFMAAAGIAHPGVVPFLADALEALVGTGRLEEAEAITQDDRLMGRFTTGGPAAVLVRGAASVRAARGDLAGSAVELEAVLADPRLVTFPFQRARTLLVAGEVARRRRRRPQARALLVEAGEAFRRLGAEVWADRADAELQRIGGFAAGELSATEAKLVALVAEGLTNREVAERLFVSVKTVEANLSRIYRSVGVRSRAELVRHVLTHGAAPVP